MEWADTPLRDDRVAQPRIRYVCQECGAEHRKWAGRCENCGAWNTVTEEAQAPEQRGASGRAGRILDLEGLVGREVPPERRLTGIAELDRVLGGGLVSGSTVLVAGDPGIGKSTLLLQASAALAGAKGDAPRSVYVSGEEATDQLRMRAQRTGLGAAGVALVAATNVDDVITTLNSMPSKDYPALLVIDSIQTMYLASIDSAPGTVAQVRAAAQALIGFAKQTGIPVFLVGHVTKEGQIAGPRILEHMVDTVLYFEGERAHQFRILRAVKNRFGPTDEIGVFEMTDGGLSDVPNPSAMFLGLEPDSDGTKSSHGPGAAVFAGIEGTRPILVEIQALVAPSNLSVPRRAVVGWDAARLAMIIAVLDARCGLDLASHDVYLNVAGGLRISEPAADLAAAAALVSSLAGSPAPEKTAFFGEIGLSGEVRPVSGAGPRLREAAKLGFSRAIAPPGHDRGTGRKPTGLAATEISSVSDLLTLFGVAPRRRSRGQGRRSPMAIPEQSSGGGIG